MNCSSFCSFPSKSGIVRGCGLQNLGAYVNLGAYYLFGIPIGAALAFLLDLRGKGLWIGLVAGSFLQSFLFTVITICTNWDKKVHTSTFDSLRTCFYLV